MTASERLYTLLAPLVDGKCYPLFIPESEEIQPPYIAYQIISTQPDNTLDGVMGHEWANVQIDIYSPDYDECISLSQRAIKELDTIVPSQYKGTQYLYDEPSGLYRAIVEYGFWQNF